MPDSEIIVDSPGNRKTYAYLCHGDFGYGKSSSHVVRHGYYDAQGSLIVLRTPTGSTTTRYAYDSWAKFRKRKGGVKAHVLYDIEAQVPAFYTITSASKHDSTAMRSIPYEPNAYYIFDRAYDSFKELYKIHLTDSFYVIRAKTNLKYKMVKWKRRMPKNVLTDAEVKLTGYLSEKKYPESFRLIRYYDEEDGREFVFLTNAKHLSALDVANLYKKRWLVELFFKWLKQHLKIKRFWGTTENAVRIQISVAIITYCLVAIVQHDMQLKRSTYEVLQILGISLTDKTHLRDLFDKTNFNDVKELDYPYFEGLFD